MNMQKRACPRLALLPKPTVTSGKCVSYDILPDGVIDWDYVEHLWVHPMRDENNGLIYAPCVVFLDNTWMPIGPIGTLEAARRTCFRCSALHDRGVKDKSDPPAPFGISPEGSIVDVRLFELGDSLPGDPWHYDEKTGEFRLNLIVLGVELANSILRADITLEERIADVDAKLKKVEGTFRSCDTIQPHLAKAYVAKAREAAVFWLTELQAEEDAEVETPEEDGRSFADAVRKEGVTYEQAVLKLGKYLCDIYSNIRNEDGTPLADAEERKHKAYKAGVERLAYFAGVSA